MNELQAIVRRLTSGPVNGAVLATLIRVEGSSYRRPGARLLVLPDGTRLGSISGGCLEDDLLARAARVRATGVGEVAVYDTTSENDLVWGVGLGCHGIVQIVLEPLRATPEWAVELARAFHARRGCALRVDAHPGGAFGTRLQRSSHDPDAFVQHVPPPHALLVFGAGDDARPLVRLGAGLGWVVTVADPRPAQATAARFPDAARVVSGPLTELVNAVPVDTRTSGVIMTHHYVHDRPLLRAMLPRPFAYLGLLGPRKRAERILSDLATEGFVPTPEQESRLHAPVGLDLGADGPDAVALAIVAEIQATLGGRDARPLRQRAHPIHA